MTSWLGNQNGLLLITGPTGMGKTTTFNYVIDLINSEEKKKIITIEDPIEYTHLSKRSLVVQQEALTDVRSFESAPAACPSSGSRRNRNRRTERPGDTLYRLDGRRNRPPGNRNHAYSRCGTSCTTHRFSFSPTGNKRKSDLCWQTVCRRLSPSSCFLTRKRKKRNLCTEILVGTNGVRHNIRDNTIHKLYTELQAGRRHGMVTMDHSLLDLYKAGDITYDTAVTAARDPETIKKRSA